ncbi:MAG: 4-hydroxy-tetrahydrodipicolinate synthase [Chlorobi bacterium]|nr:4-hydroxy-tetrahydrodipicolinate synthase [Chlorobiota bacterium]
MDHFYGLGVAIVTPFRKDSSIDFKALGRLIEHQVTGGVNYIVALGTTGEAVTLSADEKEAVVRFITEQVAGCVPVIVGIGGNNTHQIIRQIRVFPFKGISGILSVAPYYNKPTQEGLYRHYESIAAASPVPVILYNVPGRTGVNISADTIIRLAKNIDNIIAVKEASGNMAQIMTIARDKPEDFLMISGDDALTIPMMACGGAGVISVAANAWPADFSRLVTAASTGDYGKAMKIHFRYMHLIELLFADGNPGGIKAALAEMGLIENYLRLPLVSVRKKVQMQIRETMAKLVKE